VALSYFVVPAKAGTHNLGYANEPRSL
jgi:hypothetical protein